ncbi:uncharacterized protein LOC126737994 [Anthonomus grandis grandis]|uniref:uncharacterized protein LOC126737994 n=1 Tax=Anthonomus grandis grandis TaxID=2921223 RepID=UPI0021660CBC|nr:uncharacterized protein LOC126737994 [Anthonomus grandis grandis]
MLSTFRYANCDENSSVEGAVGYDVRATSISSSTGAVQENIYEPICPEPDANSRQEENIYETIEEVRQQQENLRLQQPSTSTAPDLIDPIYDPNLPSCSSSTYGRIGNAYGRIDIIGHGIGRIERHLSSSCGSINSNHYAIESLYGTSDHTGRISKVSVQWLLANKWLPLWIANTESGKDYRIIDFLIAQGLEQMEEIERENEHQARAAREEKSPSGGTLPDQTPP